jgi:hypothetical protein
MHPSREHDPSLLLLNFSFEGLLLAVTVDFGSFLLFIIAGRGDVFGITLLALEWDGASS